MSKKTKYGNHKKSINISIISLIIIIAVIFLIGYAAGFFTQKWSGTSEENKVSDTFKEGEIIDYQEEGLLSLGKYKERTVDVEPSEKEIELELQSVCEEQPITKNHTVKKGDKLVIDYVGKLNGTEFDGGSDEDAELTVGSYEEYLEDFENGLIGQEVGKTVNVDVRFPNDYGDPEFNGKTAQFEIKIKSCIPELTDTLVAKFTKNKYKTIKAYKEKVKKQLRQDYMDSLGEIVWDEIKEDTNFIKVPKPMKSVAKKDLNMEYEKVAEMEGSTVEEVISGFGMAEGDVDDLAKDKAQDYMLARTIASIEGIKLDDTTYKKALVKNLEIDEDDAGTITTASLEKKYKEANSLNPKDDMLLEMIKEFIVDHTKIKS